MYSSRRKLKRSYRKRVASRKNKTRSKRKYLKLRKMKGGGGMEFEEFKKKIYNLDQGKKFGTLEGVDTPNEENEIEKLFKDHPEHVDKLRKDRDTERAEQERMKEVYNKSVETNRLNSSNTDITPQKSEPLNFKNLFLNYIPKAAEKVYTDDEVKTKLLEHQPGPGSSFILKIPDFNGMTDDKYKNLIDLLDNLHQRGLFDEYKSIVKDLYDPADSSRTTFRQMDWMAMLNSDNEGKTNLLPTIKLLDKKLGQDNNKILRKDDNYENVYTGKFVKF